MTYIQKLFKAYPDLPREVIVKTEALRRGTNIKSAACERAHELGAFMKKSFIFTHDRAEPEPGAARPHFFVLPNGASCGLRYDPASPYSIELINGEFAYCDSGEPVMNIDIPPAHPLYHKKLNDGTPLREIIGVIIGDGAFSSVLDGCYWQNNLFCGYCDTIPHMAAKQKKNPNYIFHKNPEHVAEAFDLCWKAGLTHMNITGGAIPDRYDGKTDAEFYLQYLEAIARRTKFPDKFGIAFIAKTKEELKQIHATGIKIVAMNLEVWDPHLFSIICPGKDQVIGRDRWIQSLVDAVDIFGPGNVVTDFVAGVEMSQPHGFTDVEAALESTLGGYDYLMQRGIVPRQDFWCIEENSRLGLKQNPPPTEYFIRQTLGCYELLQKYNLPPSPYFCRKCNNIDPIHDLD